MSSGLPMMKRPSDNFSNGTVKSSSPGSALSCPHAAYALYFPSRYGRAVATARSRVGATNVSRDMGRVSAGGWWCSVRTVR